PATPSARPRPTPSTARAAPTSPATPTSPASAAGSSTASVAHPSTIADPTVAPAHTSVPTPPHRKGRGAVRSCRCTNGSARGGGGATDTTGGLGAGRAGDDGTGQRTPRGQATSP